MLFAVVGSSSISSTRIEIPPRFDRERYALLTALEAVINHSMSEGKRLIMCNALEYGGIVAQESQTAKRPLMLDQRILFIDAQAMVIDKPAGLPVDTPRRGGDSVTDRLDELKLGFQRPPTPMHRLDQDTSGCLLLARNPKARSVLQKAFEARQVGKYYLAVVDAEIEQDEGVIEISLGKKSSAEAGWRMVADPKGDQAITHWRKIEARGGRTPAGFKPVTGRTHQLR